MKLSKSFIKTYKDDASTEIISHNLLQRGGYIKQLTRGIYTYLPLSTRIILKIENIIREELERINAQEIIMPILQPSDLWQESGRYQAYGKELMRLKDRNQRDFLISPTAEEVVVSIVRDTVSSYKQLPVHFFQFQTKFRDELRPRYGLMRGREFIMKDGYSFHVTEEDLNREYLEVKKAYIRAFDRFQIKYRAVEADTGSIGGSSSHEFMVLADCGEDDILYSDKSDYAANIEKASMKIEEYVVNEDKKKIEEVHTPNITTIEDLKNFLNIDSKRCIKSVVFSLYDEEKNKKYFYIGLCRGDLDINEVKMKNALNISIDGLELASDEDIEKLNLHKGFIGPLKDDERFKDITVVADLSLKSIINSVMGANKKDYHLKNVNIEDLKIDKFYDLHLAKEGAKSPFDDGTLHLAKGIEVGHIFNLGDKYTKSLKCTVLDNNGKQITPIMGCYGIGISRLIPAIVEQNHDERGIIWPVSIAPYHVIIVVANIKEEKQLEEANKIYETLQQKGIEVILDDRNEKIGYKFKDAELLGIPFRITVGKDIENDIVEFTERKTMQTEKISIDEAINKLELIK